MKVKVDFGINYGLEDLEGSIENLFRYTAQYFRRRVNQVMIKIYQKYINTLLK